MITTSPRLTHQMSDLFYNPSEIMHGDTIIQLNMWVGGCVVIENWITKYQNYLKLDCRLCAEVKLFCGRVGCSPLYLER